MAEETDGRKCSIMMMPGENAPGKLEKAGIYDSFFPIKPASSSSNSTVFLRTRDPRRGTHAPGAKVIGSGTEELVPNVQGILATDSPSFPVTCGTAETTAASRSKPALAHRHTPALVPDVHKDVPAAVEGTEGEHAGCGQLR